MLVAPALHVFEVHGGKPVAELQHRGIGLTLPCHQQVTKVER